MSFLSELKRRRVVRVAAAYAVAAVAVISAASDILPALDAPAWTVTLVVVLALLGFVAAVGLAWAFDWNEEGVVRAGDAAEGAPRRASSTPLRLAAAGGALLVLGGGAWYAFGSALGEAETVDSVAVLPFVDLSPARDQAYFSDGIAEELLTALGRVPELRVAARSASFRFRGPEVDPVEVGERLGVAAVLEGSVRRDGEDVRIDARLVDAGTGYEFWSESYTRRLTSIFAVQEEVAREIVRALHLRLGGGAADAMVKAGTENLRAYDLYLRGRHQFRAALMGAADDAARTALLGSIETYRQALALDSTYALPWAGIAEVYTFLADDFWPPREAHPKAREAAERALALDSELAQAHAALALVLMLQDWDWEGAEREFQRALALDSTVAEVHSGYAQLLTVQGRCEEALARLDRAARLDAEIERRLGYWLRPPCGQGPAMADSLRAVLAAGPDVGAYQALWNTLITLGRLEEARGVLEEGTPHGAFPSEPERRSAGMVMVLARTGDPEGARRVLARAVEACGRVYCRASMVAVGYASLGETDEAFRWLARAERDRDGYLALMPLLPWPDAARSDPRFVRLMARVGVPAQSRVTPRPTSGSSPAPGRTR